MPNNDIITISGNDGNEESSAIVASLVNANRLEVVEEPNAGLSFMLVDRNTNTGYLIDFNSLCETIRNKIFADDETSSLKFYVVEE